MKLQPSTGDFRRHKEGHLYQGWLRNYETRAGEYGDFLLWLLDGEDIEPDTRLMTSTSLSERSKLGKWVKKIFPDYDFESELDLDLLIGQPVAIMFEHIKQDDGSWNERGDVVAKGTLEPKDYSDEAPF